MYAFLPHKVCVKECPTQTTSLYAYAVAKDHAGDLPIDQIPGFPNFDLDFQRSLCVPYLTDADWEDATDTAIAVAAAAIAMGPTQCTLRGLAPIRLAL